MKRLPISLKTEALEIKFPNLISKTKIDENVKENFGVYST